jgi:uncharacterized glyoxalase superfamily protein PhnB
MRYYQDVLGFEVRPVASGDGVAAVAEAVRGPARIQFVIDEVAFDSTGNPHPRGSAILFLETDDVAAMHDFVGSRGGAPSELLKVNLLKMRMFEVTDPDGHRIWFGQSFQQPDKPRPKSPLAKAMPHLPFDDVAAGVAYYRDVLGFSINHAQHDLGVMDHGDVTLLLIARTEKHTGIGSCYIYVDNADSLYETLAGRGAKIPASPVSHPWGLRDFQVIDLEGNELWFGQPFE